MEAINKAVIKEEPVNDNCPDNSSVDMASAVKIEQTDVSSLDPAIRVEIVLEATTDVKQDMDVGPIVLQPPDVHFKTQQSSRGSRWPCQPEPVEDSSAQPSTTMYTRTPSPSPSRRATPRCHSNPLLHVALDEGFSNIDAGYNVPQTPGGSFRVQEGEQPVVGRTLGRTVRKLKVQSPAEFLMPPEERVERAELSDEDVEDLVGTNFNHIRRWLRDSDQPSAEGHYQEPLMEGELASSEQRAPSTGQPVQPTQEPPVKEELFGSLGTSAGSEAPGAAGGIGSAFIESLHLSPTPHQKVSPVPGTSGVRVTRADPDYGRELDSEYDDDLDFPDRIAPQAGARELPSNDELDDADAAMLAEADRIMDNAQNELPDISFDFDWCEDFSNFRGTRGTFTGGPTGPTRVFETPYDAFVGIWDEGIMKRIADETNRYAWQTIVSMIEDGKLTDKARLNEWYETDIHELYVLFAMFIVMGFTPRLRQIDYWLTSCFFDNPGIRSVMSYNRFILLNKFLHFVDNYDDVSCTQTKLSKLVPIISHCNSKFQELYVLDEHIAIYESLTLWKERLAWAQCIKTRAARFVIKSFELCESSTGYLWRFVIYTGKESGQAFSSATGELAGRTTALVVDLLNGLEFKGYYLTMENFYNSPVLARYLKSRGFDCVGTLRVNRKNVPKGIKIPKNVAKGTIVARHSGDVAVLSWKDQKVVSTISTIHDASTFTRSKRLKGKTHPVAHTMPVVVRDYNKYMGGIDLKDQKLSMYLMERKQGLKWYVKMFKWLLNVSVHNAYVLHRRTLQFQGGVGQPHRQFREELATVLVKTHTKKIVTTVPSEIRLRRDILHIPTKYGRTKRRRCVICSKREKKPVKVLTGCLTCDKGLCFDPKTCWETYHSMVDLQ